MAYRKRSFRLSEVQAEVVMFVLLYYLAASQNATSPLQQAHRKSSEILYKKLSTYEFTTEV